MSLRPATSAVAPRRTAKSWHKSAKEINNRYAPSRNRTRGLQLPRPAQADRLALSRAGYPTRQATGHRTEHLAAGHCLWRRRAGDRCRSERQRPVRAGQPRRRKWASSPTCAAAKPNAVMKRRTRVLILGVNGFIGNHLTERLLRDDRYDIYGPDIGSDAISRFLDNPRFTSWKATSASTLSGSSITSRNATWCCRWWRSRRRSNTPVTRCACSSWTSKRT